VLNPVHLYNEADTFYVNLLVLNPNTGCSNTVEQALIVRPLPETGFSFSNACEETQVSFTDTSAIQTGIIEEWNWSFGTLGTDSVQDPLFTFQDPGTYPVTLNTSSDYGCSASFTSSIVIYPKPDANFLSDPVYGSPPLTVNFNNSTTGAVLYSWTFGDGGTSFDFSPSHIFTDTGDYVTTLTATSNEGCTETHQQLISV
jgi:PKD repeat protein